MEDELLALSTRRRLYDAVRGTPGIGAREAQRIAGTAWGETVYHLDRLTEAGLLHRERAGHQDHYFVAEVPLGDRRFLRLARSPSARRLLLTLLEAPDCTVPDLSERTAMSFGRLSVHLRRLIDLDMIATGRRGRLRTFRLANPERVTKALVTYRETFADKWVEHWFETWSELFRP